MALYPNQFALTTEVGRKIHGEAVITAEFYSATGTDTIAAGEFVTISSTTNGQVTKVAKGSALTSAYVGMVLSDPLKETFAVGDKVTVALLGVVALAKASAAITAGAALQYAYSTGKVATNASVGTNTTVGIALENAAADGDLLRVLINTPMK